MGHGLEAWRNPLLGTMLEVMVPGVITRGMPNNCQMAVVLSLRLTHFPLALVFCNRLHLWPGMLPGEVG